MLRQIIWYGGSICQIAVGFLVLTSVFTSFEPGSLVVFTAGLTCAGAGLVDIIRGEH